MLLGDRLEWSCNCWERAGNFCRLPTTSGIDGSIYWKRTCPIRHCPTVRLSSLPVATSTVAAHKMSCGQIDSGLAETILLLEIFHGIHRIFTHVQGYDSFNVFFKRCQVRFRCENEINKQLNHHLPQLQVRGGDMLKLQFLLWDWMKDTIDPKSLAFGLKTLVSSNISIHWDFLYPASHLQLTGSTSNYGCINPQLTDFIRCKERSRPLRGPDVAAF